MASAASRLNDWHGTTATGHDRAHASFTFATVDARPLGARMRLAARLPSNTEISRVSPEGSDPDDRDGTLGKDSTPSRVSVPGWQLPESRIIAAMNRAITSAETQQQRAVGPGRWCRYGDSPFKPTR